jgi:hypothetical protein
MALEVSHKVSTQVASRPLSGAVRVEGAVHLKGFCAGWRQPPTHGNSF